VSSGCFCAHQNVVIEANLPLYFTEGGGKCPPFLHVSVGVHVHVLVLIPCVDFSYGSGTVFRSTSHLRVTSRLLLSLEDILLRTRLPVITVVVPAK